MKLAKNEAGKRTMVIIARRASITGSAIAIIFAAVWFYAGSSSNSVTSGANVGIVAESNDPNQTSFDHGMPLNDAQSLLETGSSDKARLRENYGDLPLTFEANQGQTNRVTVQARQRRYRGLWR